MDKKEKYIGESPLKGEPTKKLVLTIKDGSVTTPKIADRAVTPEKLSTRVKSEVVKPLVDAAKADLQNQIDSLEVSGIALSQEFGDNPNIGISQKVLTEKFAEILEQVGGSKEVIVCKHWLDTAGDPVDPQEGDFIYVRADKIYRWHDNAAESYSAFAENVLYIDGDYTTQDYNSVYYYDGTSMQLLLSKDEVISTIDTSSTSAVNSTAVANYIQAAINSALTKDTTIQEPGSTSSVPTSSAVVSYVEKKFTEGKEVFTCVYWDGSPSNWLGQQGDYAINTTLNKLCLKGMRGWSAVDDLKEDTIYIKDCVSPSRSYYWDGAKLVEIGQVLEAGDNINISNGVISSTGGGGSVVKEEHIVDTTSTNVPMSKAVVEYVNNTINNIDLDGNEGWGEPDFNDPLRPEYYLEKVVNGQTIRVKDYPEQIANVRWGIPFYDMPLRCYNGNSTAQFLNRNSPEDASHNPIVVFAPSERIIYNMFDYKDSTNIAKVVVNTNSVKYNTRRKCFVLEYGGSVYCKWGNSEEWNTYPDDYDTNTSTYPTARKDRLFSDISSVDNKPDELLADIRYYRLYKDSGNESILPNTTLNAITSEEKIAGLRALTRTLYEECPDVNRSFRINPGKRTTKVFGLNGVDGLSEDISYYMDDFTKAIVACITANNGSMHLSNRIYFMGNIKDNSNYRILLYDKDGFEIDGGKGVIFARRMGTGCPQKGTFVNFRHGSDINNMSEVVGTRTYNRDGTYSSGSSVYTLNEELVYNALKQALQATGAWTSQGATDSLPAHKYKDVRIIGSQESTDNSISIFDIKRSRNGIFKNLTIKALRDADNGAPSGHLRFSCSDSRLKAFSITKNYSTDSDNDTIGVKNMTFENLNITGMYEDFKCAGASEAGQTYIENIHINGWKSDCFQNAIRGYDWKVSNAHLTQPDYIGTGIHIIYSQGTPSKGISFDHCVFKQGDCSSVFITYHGAKQSRDWHFTNCEFYGNLLFQGKDYRGWTTFEDCYFYQLGLTAASDENQHTQIVVSRMFGSFGHNINFNNCRIHQLSKYLVSKGTPTYQYVGNPSGNPSLRNYYEIEFVATTDKKIIEDKTYYVQDSIDDTLYLPVDEDTYQTAVENESSPAALGWYVPDDYCVSTDTTVNASKKYYIKKWPTICLFDTGITVPIGVTAPYVTDSTCAVYAKDSEIIYDGAETEKRVTVLSKEANNHYDFVTTKDVGYRVKEETSADFIDVRNGITFNKTALYGETNGSIATTSDRPVSAKQGDKYYVVADNKIYSCTAEGTHGQVVILVRDPQGSHVSSTPADGSVTITITLSSDEIITGDIQSSATLTQAELFDRLASFLEQKGYIKQLWKNREPGTYSIKGDYLRVTAKYGGSGTQSGSDSSSNYIDSKGVGLWSRASGPNPCNRVAGESPAWDSGTTLTSLTAAGLIGRISLLEARVTALEEE